LEGDSWADKAKPGGLVLSACAYGGKRNSLFSLQEDGEKAIDFCETAMNWSTAIFRKQRCAAGRWMVLHEGSWVFCTLFRGWKGGGCTLGWWAIPGDFGFIGDGPADFLDMLEELGHRWTEPSDVPEIVRRWLSNYWLDEFGRMPSDGEVRALLRFCGGKGGGPLEHLKG
jgi:hypothetical protein